MNYSIDQIIANNQGLTSRMVGCDAETIQKLESKYGLSFPPIYRQFLMTMGCSRGVEKYGQFSFMPELRNNSEVARDELKGDLFPLPEDAFVFSSRQAYSFFYFHCDGNPDPVVYRLVTGDEMPLIAAPTLSEYLFRRLNLLFEDIDGLNM